MLIAEVWSDRIVPPIEKGATVRDHEGLLDATATMTMPAFLLALSTLFASGPIARNEAPVRDAASGGQGEALAPAPMPAMDAVPDPVGFGSLSTLLDDVTWDQVRIEQRLIIRITPRAPGPGPDVMREMAGPPIALRERKAEKCLAVPSIFGVKPVSNSRIVLFTRDRRLYGADLDRSCNAQDFYSGFYVESAADGRLCVKRDTIHSRAGTSCTISRLRELEP